MSDSKPGSAGFQPAPPLWQIDWNEITSLDWFKPMIGCKQDPLHHAEGDVATHVRLVCEALTALEEWRQLSETERYTVFLGALLHDVAKPACTVEDENGRVTSANHGKKGAQDARRILWRGEGFADQPPDLTLRETVSSLVRNSSLPFWLWDKDDPTRSIIRASQSVRPDFLALLSEADARGRSCQDLPELLSRLKLFREYAHEQQCWDHPYEFPSDHSRFTYFHKHSEKSDPAREVYDDTQFEVTLMSGLPGAGKDHWIRENAGSLPIVSLDEIRSLRKIAATKDQGEVIRLAREEAKRLLRTRQSFIWNGTNITRFIRDPLIRFFHDYGARIRIVYIEPPKFRDLIGRNDDRENSVPRATVEKLADKLEVPDRTEAHEVLWVKA